MGPQKPQPQIAVQDFIDFGNDRNFSDKALMDTARFVRRYLGKNYVEENLEKTLPKVKLQLKDFFVLKMANTLKKKNPKSCPELNLIKDKIPVLGFDIVGITAPVATTASLVTAAPPGPGSPASSSPRGQDVAQEVHGGPLNILKLRLL